MLHSTKYGEGQLIVHMLTRAHGRQSYITRLGRSTAKNNATGAARGLFQPLFMVEFQGQQGHGQLHKMSQASLYRQLSELPFDIVKSSISLFMSELLYRLITGHEPEDERLYGFVEESVTALDSMQSGVSNFHLHFMLRLMHYMGIAPLSNHQQNWWLDIKNGRFVATEPQHTLKIKPTTATHISTLNTLTVMELDYIKLHQAERIEIMNALVDYYHFHTDAISSVRSIRILGEIF